MDLTYREAKESDVQTLVALLADDDLGERREEVYSPLNQRYLDAFRSIEKDSNNELVVAELQGELVGVLQLTFIPYLTHHGSWRCLIEGVRIARPHRGKGLGSKFIIWAINRAKERQCSIVQLTSDKRRSDALRFYEAHGFQATHEGLKLKI